MAFKKGHKPWNKGTHIQTTANLSGLELGHQKGSKHHLWKGDKASYSAIHYWVQRQKGKAAFCYFDPSHFSTRYHWANVSGLYLRDVNDYIPLCPSCHARFDDIANKARETRRRDK